jgi:hypothetical protein
MKQILGTLLLCLAGLECVYGQQTTATLVGTVTDPSAALVSGATVAVTNIQTGVRREAKTDSTGNYSVPFGDSGEGER